MKEKILIYQFWSAGEMTIRPSYRDLALHARIILIKDISQNQDGSLRYLIFFKIIQL